MRFGEREATGEASIRRELEVEDGCRIGSDKVIAEEIKFKTGINRRVISWDRVGIKVASVRI
ncbi:MAG: hypothetical protein IH968_16550 [Gemmatimonadetes bacterium]|nr:hypothetical protein [Gemmatimonadota bacterium]